MGYNATAPANERFQDLAVMAMSWGNDLSTIMAAFQQNSTGPIKDVSDAAQSDLSGGHCSGFVRVLPDNEDVYFSHDTWSSFNSMMRVYKLYDMPCVACAPLAHVCTYAPRL